MRADSSYPLYTEYLRSTPQFLTKEEETELGRRMAQEGGDVVALNRLVMQHIPLVVTVVRTFGPKNPEEREDFLGAGIIGLYEAAKKWEYERENRFSTFAVYDIRQKVREEMRTSRAQVQVRNYAKDRVVDRAHQALTVQLKREPTFSEIAEHTHLSLEQVMRAHFRRQAVQGPSLQAPLSSKAEVDGTSEVGDFLVDVSFFSPSQMLEAREEMNESLKYVKNALKRLEDNSISERNRNIFKMYYGLEKGGSGIRKTLDELAQEYSLSRERIRQLLENMWSWIDETVVYSSRNDPLTSHFRRIMRLQELLSNSEER